MVSYRGVLSTVITVTGVRSGNWQVWAEERRLGKLAAAAQTMARRGAAGSGQRAGCWAVSASPAKMGGQGGRCRLLPLQLRPRGRIDG